MEEKVMLYKVILRKVNVTKNGKSVVTYDYKDTDTKQPNYFKGMKEGQLWTDNDKLFNQLTDEDFGIVLKGTFGYEERYDGTLSKQLKHAETQDGKVLI